MSLHLKDFPKLEPYDKVWYYQKSQRRIGVKRVKCVFFTTILKLKGFQVYMRLLL